MTVIYVAVIAIGWGSGCGTEAPGEGGGPDGDPTGDGGPALTDDELSTEPGCEGVFNPDQILDYHIELPAGDWNSLLADQTNAIYFEAEFRCGDGPAIAVGVRRKRSGGAQKVGLKVDMNEFVAGQRYFGLRKLSLENGVSEGDSEDGAEVSAYLSEYLAWRMMVRSGAISGRAVFARVHVNGDLLGVYVNVEQVDKRFLANRLGDDSGWLYKKSGSDRDGLKTHEADGLADPYAEFFCFWDAGRNGCAPPPAQELAQTLPENLDLDQMLRFGAVNALIANTDSPLFKDNNYYWYDWAGGRTYIPWDLDTVMKSSFDVFAGGGIGGQTGIYTDVLFSNWEGDYAAIMAELLSERLTLEVIESELDRAVTVAADAFAGDRFVSGSLAGAADSLAGYFAQRHAAVQASVDAR